MYTEKMEKEGGKEEGRKREREREKACRTKANGMPGVAPEVFPRPSFSPFGLARPIILRP